MDRISSRQNAVVQRFREAARGSGPSVLIDGEHLLHEPLRSSVPIDIVAIAERHSHSPMAALADAASRAGARTILVTDPVLDAISPVRHPSGVVALARRPTASIAEVLAPTPQRVVVLVGVQDPGNVGAIVRAAEACGATGVIATAGTADPFGWKAMRGGMGSTFRMPVCTRQPLDVVLAVLRKRGIGLLATVPRNGTPLPDGDLTGPIALLLGAEGAGLPADAAAASDIQITIPMHAPVESLNVAVAAAIVLYEAARQRE